MKPRHQQGHAPSKGSRGGFSLASSWLPALARNPGLQTHHSSVCLHHHMTISLCVSVSCLLIRLPVTLD